MPVKPLPPPHFFEAGIEPSDCCGCSCFVGGLDFNVRVYELLCHSGWKQQVECVLVPPVCVIMSGKLIPGRPMKMDLCMKLCAAQRVGP